MDDDYNGPRNVYGTWPSAEKGTFTKMDFKRPEIVFSSDGKVVFNTGSPDSDERIKFEKQALTNVLYAELMNRVFGMLNYDFVNKSIEEDGKIHRFSVSHDPATFVLLKNAEKQSCFLEACRRVDAELGSSFILRGLPEGFFAVFELASHKNIERKNKSKQSQKVQQFDKIRKEIDEAQTMTKIGWDANKPAQKVLRLMNEVEERDLF